MRVLILALLFFKWGFDLNKSSSFKNLVFSRETSPAPLPIRDAKKLEVKVVHNNLQVPFVKKSYISQENDLPSKLVLSGPLMQENSMADLQAEEKKWYGKIYNYLKELDPINADLIFKAFSHEIHSYEASVEKWLRDSSSDESIEEEVSHLLQRHEERLKNILGIYYEDIMSVSH